jgi:HSP20 family protein
MSTFIKCQNQPDTLSNLFHNFFENSLFDNSAITETDTPKIDISESKKYFKLIADLPGVDKKNISITIKDGVLQIEGERTDERKNEEGMYYHFERSSSKFSRSFLLPEEVDPEKVSASMKNGVLELTLLKSEKIPGKTIDVKFL